MAKLIFKEKNAESKKIPVTPYKVIKKALTISVILNVLQLLWILVSLKK